MAVVLYDGDCGVCEAAIRFVLARDRAGHFQFARQQGEIGRALLARHGLSHEGGRTLVLVEDGCAWVRSEAILRIARRLPSLSWLAPLARVAPRSWRDAAYDAFARRRHRFAGGRSCPALGPELRRRFLDG